jgi:beta-phosphoglucomutase
VREPKPSEEGYVAALARLHRRAVLAPIACVALEDSIAGIRAARRAGLRCVAVGALPVHRALEADGVVASLVGITPRLLETVAPVPSGFAPDSVRGTRPA